MAVYERTYRPYTGDVTPERTRFLVLPRYAYDEVFRSKLFVAFLVACYLLPLGYAVLIYIPHNLSFLKIFQITTEDVLSVFGYDAGFFLRFLIWQGWMAFLVAFVVGPALISADLRNNGLPLYLSRPFSKPEYILGKSTIMIALLSAVTWVPGLLLFLLQSYLGGWKWFREHYFIGIAIFLCSWIWILLLCLISLALSAYVKWKPLARAALFGVFFVASAAGEMVNFMFRTEWGDLINVSNMIQVVWADLFGAEPGSSVPPLVAWLALLTFCGMCLWLLQRKVRAYEVVR